MSNPHLPPEIIDSIVDHLHDNSNALKESCLVSKSWVPRTRKHLFAEIKLDTEADLTSWKEMFPDPSTSPAHHTETLHVGCLHVVTVADAEASDWIRGFSRVVNLKLDALQTYFEGAEIFLVPFHRLSPTVKSLYVDLTVLPPSRIFNLVLSFPLLEDLILVGNDTSIPIHNGDGSDGFPTTIQLTNSPALTGSLELQLGGRIGPIVPRLLSLPGGIRFRNLNLTLCREEDHSLVNALLEGCSYTLESLNISHDLDCTSIDIHAHTDTLLLFPARSEATPIDLSKATRLKGVTFGIGSWSVEWVTVALRTITPEHQDLRQISIHETHCSRFVERGAEVRRLIGVRTARLWSELDHFLVQLWESRSIRPKMLYGAFPGKERAVRDLTGYFLPEITRRGIVDLVGVRHVGGWG